MCFTSSSLGSCTSAIHSHTLPAKSAISSNPAPAGYKPTGVTRRTVSAKLALEASGISSPQGNRPPFGPLAALSHSASVGSRTPAQLQYADASYQFTPTTGQFGYLS